MSRRFCEAVLLAWLSKTARGGRSWIPRSENSLLCLRCAVRIPSLALAGEERRQNRLRSGQKYCPDRKNRNFQNLQKYIIVRDFLIFSSFWMTFSRFWLPRSLPGCDWLRSLTGSRWAVTHSPRCTKIKISKPKSRFSSSLRAWGAAGAIGTPCTHAACSRWVNAVLWQRLKLPLAWFGHHTLSDSSNSKCEPPRNCTRQRTRANPHKKAKVNKHCENFNFAKNPPYPPPGVYI